MTSASTSVKTVPVRAVGLPGVGFLPNYALHPLETLQRIARDHGDAVHFSIGAFESLLVSDPQLIEEVLITNNKAFHKDPFLRSLQQMLGFGLLTSEGDFWRRQRRLAQPAFHREKINNFASTMVQCTQKYLSTIYSGQVREIHHDMMKLTLDIVARTLFHADVASKAEEIGEVLEVVSVRYADPTYAAFPWLERLPTPSRIRFESAIQRINTVIESIIDQSDQNQSDDVISMLRQARDDDGSQMSRKQLRDEVVTLISAGHETTALALSWTWYLLSKHPVVRKRLEQEIDDVLGGRSVTLADLPRLKLAEYIILESMRLYPPAWSLGREAVQHCTIGNIHIKPGQQIWMSQWVVHRDPRNFPYPDVFDPDRWENDLAKKLHKFAYFPFGGGPRQCIGNGFAMLEAILLLVTIAQKLRIDVLPEHPVIPQPAITLRPKHGVRALVTAR